MNACASCAISGVALSPVPIAQTGSYAMTRRSSCGRAVTWRRRTSSVSSASRCSSVSPTHAITPSPAASAASARRATPSSVSPKSCRRSEWPTSEPATPSSRSIGAEISPVNAPSGSQWTFCAYVVRPAATQSARRVYGGQTIASRPASASGSGPRNIFQLPATITSSYDGIAATPGSSFPSSSSRLAPPPVETHETRSARPSSLSARTESAPPTTVNASAFAATASATAFVPVGEARPLEDAHRAVPEDRPRRRERLGEARARLRPDVEAEPAVGQLVVAADARLGVGGELRGADDVDRAARRGSRAGFPSRSSSAIFPPISTVSARPPRLRSTPSLSSTFAPPEMRTNGRSISPSRRPRCSSSSSRRRPAYAGRRCATASVEACARCAEPNASLT